MSPKALLIEYCVEVVLADAEVNPCEGEIITQRRGAGGVGDGGGEVVRDGYVTGLR